MTIDVDSTLVDCIRTRNRRRRTTSQGTGCTLWARGETTPPNRSPRCCGLETPGRTPPSTTSTWSASPSMHSPPPTRPATGPATTPPRWCIRSWSERTARGDPHVPRPPTGPQPGLLGRLPDQPRRPGALEQLEDHRVGARHQQRRQTTARRPSSRAHRARRPQGLARRGTADLPARTPHPGAPLSLFDQTTGWRHTAFITDSPQATTSPHSNSANANTPASKTASAAGKTLRRSHDSPTGTHPPTKPGSHLTHRHRPSSPGRSSSASTANSPKPNPPPSAPALPHRRPTRHPRPAT